MAQTNKNYQSECFYLTILKVAYLHLLTFKFENRFVIFIKFIMSQNKIYLMEYVWKLN